MVTTYKAESEKKEAKDKVRARSAVATEVVDGSKELCSQITKLMAALTMAEQGTILQGRGNTQGPNGGQGMKDLNSLQCFQCQGWGHIARECATPAKMLNKDGGELRECGQTPC